MDPCPFVRVIIGNLAVRFPIASKPARSGVHPSTSPCYCRLRLSGQQQHQTAAVQLLPADSTSFSDLFPSATFHLSLADLYRLSSRRRLPKVYLAIYTGRRGTTCGVSSGKLLGKISIPLDLKLAENRPVVFHSGWVPFAGAGKDSSASAQLHFTVRAEPDPRFVFEFGGEPECSPQVFQLSGATRQPVFTCKFSCRNTNHQHSNSDMSLRSRSMPTEGNGKRRSWLGSFGSDRERPAKERKGWSVTVHDLCGAPVAMASMVTPFVASRGSDRVSRSNPGAWLILRPSEGTWKPWGRLEAWRERGGTCDGLGYKFELVPDGVPAGVTIAENSLSTSKGGKLTIDLSGTGNNSNSRSTSPGCSPIGSGDYAMWPFMSYRGFVMSSTVGGEGKGSRPSVEVGVVHVACAEDAAVFVALAAAMDLSMDACRLFSHRLKKEFECIN